MLGLQGLEGGGEGGGGAGPFPRQGGASVPLPPSPAPWGLFSWGLLLGAFLVPPTRNPIITPYRGRAPSPPPS